MNEPNKEPIDLNQLTLEKILEYYLKPEDAKDMLSAIEKAINEEHLSGDVLKERIFKLLCEKNVLQADVYCIMSTVPVVITKMVIPGK